MTLTTPLAEVQEENGILHTTITQEEMTLELIQAHVAAIKAHYGERLPMPSITNSGKLKGGTKESRDFSAGEEMSSVFSCNAMIAGSIVTKTLGSLFLMFNKPKTPTKLFTDKQKAIEWATQFKKQS